MTIDLRARPGLRTGAVNVSVVVTGDGFSLNAATAAPLTVAENFETGDQPASATAIQPGQLQFGHMGHAGDVDYFSVAAPAQPGSHINVVPDLRELRRRPRAVPPGVGQAAQPHAPGRRRRPKIGPSWTRSSAWRRAVSPSSRSPSTTSRSPICPSPVSRPTAATASESVHALSWDARRRQLPHPGVGLQRLDQRRRVQLARHGHAARAARCRPATPARSPTTATPLPTCPRCRRSRASKTLVIADRNRLRRAYGDGARPGRARRHRPSGRGPRSRREAALPRRAAGRANAPSRNSTLARPIRSARTTSSAPSTLVSTACSARTAAVVQNIVVVGSDEIGPPDGAHSRPDRDGQRARVHPGACAVGRRHRRQQRAARRGVVRIDPHRRSVLLVRPVAVPRHLPLYARRRLRPARRVARGHRRRSSTSSSRPTQSGDGPGVLHPAKSLVTGYDFMAPLAEVDQDHAEQPAHAGSGGVADRRDLEARRHPGRVPRRDPDARTSWRPWPTTTRARCARPIRATDSSPPPPSAGPRRPPSPAHRADDGLPLRLLDLEPPLGRTATRPTGPRRCWAVASPRSSATPATASVCDPPWPSRRRSWPTSPATSPDAARPRAGRSQARLPRWRPAQRVRLQGHGRRPCTSACRCSGPPGRATGRRALPAPRPTVIDGATGLTAVDLVGVEPGRQPLAADQQRRGQVLPAAGRRVDRRAEPADPAQGHPRRQPAGPRSSRRHAHRPHVDRREQLQPGVGPHRGGAGRGRNRGPVRRRDLPDRAAVGRQRQGVVHPRPVPVRPERHVVGARAPLHPGQRRAPSSSRPARRTARRCSAASPPSKNGATASFRAVVDDPGGGTIRQVAVLFNDGTSNVWTFRQLAQAADGSWVGGFPVGVRSLPVLRPGRDQPWAMSRSPRTRATTSTSPPARRPAPTSTREINGDGANGWYADGTTVTLTGDPRARRSRSATTTDRRACGPPASRSRSTAPACTRCTTSPSPGGETGDVTVPIDAAMPDHHRRADLGAQRRRLVPRAGHRALRLLRRRLRRCELRARPHGADRRHQPIGHRSGRRRCRQHRHRDRGRHQHRHRAADDQRCATTAPPNATRVVPRARSPSASPAPTSAPASPRARPTRPSRPQGANQSVTGTAIDIAGNARPSRSPASTSTAPHRRSPARRIGPPTPTGGTRDRSP